MSSSSQHLTAPEIVKKLNLKKGTFDSWVNRGKFNEAIIFRRGENGNRCHVFDYDKVVQIIRHTTSVQIDAPSPAAPSKQKKQSSSSNTREIDTREIDTRDEHDLQYSKTTGAKELPPHMKAKAMREGYMAQLARLEYEEKIGKLVEAKTVKRLLFNTARTVRNNLLAIPGRIASEISAIKDDKEIELLIQTEIITTLEGLQNVSLAES